MPTFKGGTAGQAPLRLQLKAPANVSARVYSIYAAGETASGEASRPLITRPGTIGSGNSLPVTTLSGIASARCTLTDSFSVGSSLPAATSLPAPLPIVIQWEAPKGSGIILGGQGREDAILLYANASSTHTWTASISWEES